MAQTLNATLAAAQESTERHPLIEVLSDKFVPDIPFTGQRLAADFEITPGGDFGESPLQEMNPNAITLSDGRLAIATVFTSGGTFQYIWDNIRLTLSNADRTVFTDYIIPFWSQDAAIVEMSGGKIGIWGSGGDYAVVDVTTSIGTVLSSGTLSLPSFNIPSYVNTENRTQTGSVIRRTDGKYMAVYVDDPGGAHTAITLHYVLSDDFVTWGSAVEIPTPNLDAGNAKYNPFLFQTENGDLNVLFEYVELWAGAIGTTEKVNIYHYVSSDNGATWTYAPGSEDSVFSNGRTFGAITNYPDFTVTPRHPYAIPLGAGSWRISYHEAQAALHLSTGYVVGTHFDEVSRRAYVVNYNPNDYGNLSSISVVDPDTWSVVKTINSGSSPTFSSFWFGGGGWSETVGERELTVIRKGNHIGIYNAETDQVTEFHFDASIPYSIDANITPKARGTTGGPAGAEEDMAITRMFLDYDNQVLYLYWQTGYIWGGCLGVGKIDLTQSGPEYTHDVLFTKSASGWGFEFSEAEMAAIAGTGGFAAGDFKVYPLDNLIVITGGWKTNFEGLGGPWIGVTALYSMAGDLIKHFNTANSDTYPYRGLQKVVKVGSYLYGVFLYEPLYDNAGRRGLARVDLADFSVQYFRPTFAAVDDYTLNNLIFIKDGDELVLSSDSYGASRFVIADATWVSYMNATLPGLFPSSESCEKIAYDTANEGIFLGSYGNQMLIYFNEDGFFNQPQYLEAAYSDPAWSYGSASPLVSGLKDKDLVMTTDPASSGGMYTFWVHVNDDGSTRIRWDKDVAEFDLTGYLVAGSAVSIKRSIDGTPHKLSFSVTHGHLFDPHNVDSLWSPVLKKFRRIKVRFGENISGVEYWHDAGTFVVTNGKLSYERGTYPTMQVEAEDIRTWWEDAEIVATDHYEATPETILTDIISTWGSLAAEDVVLPAMYGSYEVWFQWLDTTVKKVVDALCNRFGYFPTITVDNKFTCRPISNVNAVDHTYPNGTMIVSFTPNDDFSDFTNRVVVAGETRDFIDVLYEEESVGSLFGTSGWWGNKQTLEVWYSDDHQRKAKNPRLKIIESVVSNSFVSKLGGGSEGIVSVDPDEFFCTIQVEVPDMSVIAWTLGAAVLVVGIAMGVTGSYTPNAGWAAFIGWVVLLSMLLYILSGIVNWQYEIWARPYGQQRLGCSGEANDVDLQALLNRVNEKKIDEPLAINPPQCQWLAEHELMIAMAQRNRVGFEKIAHLQDEEGDTLVLPHPYTGKNMTVFVTDLTRTFQIPKMDGGEGGFMDSIEGWKVAPV